MRRLLVKIEECFAAAERFLARVGDVGRRRLRIHILLGRRFRRGVPEIVEIFAVYFRRAEEVDVRLRAFLICCACGNAQRVDEEVKAFLREAEAKILVFLGHHKIVAGVVRRDPRLAALHLVIDLIHDIRLYERLLLDELVGRGAQLVLVARVERIPEHGFRDREGVARVIEHQNLSGVFAVPEKIPAADVLFVHIGAVVDDADRAPGVGDGVEVVGVVGGILIRLVYVPVVRNVVKVQRQEQPLVDQPADHIVGRNDDVIRRAAGLELGIHRLVRVERHVIHMNARRLLEGGIDIDVTVRAVGNILAPVVDVDRAGSGVRLGCGEQRGAQQQCKHERDHTLFHALAPFFPNTPRA